MADTKITALTALTAADPANDVIPIVDVSDTTMAASGTTKKISVNNILGASGTATLASATITGALVVDTTTLVVDATNDRVGFGTASPAQGVHLSKSSTSTALTSPPVGGASFRIQNTSSTNNNFGSVEFYNAAGLFGASVNCQSTSQSTPTNDLVFVTRGSGGGVEQMRVASTGNVNISTGNVVMSTSGKGIDFSATADSSGTMTSELLNDYEEGTWVGTLKGSVSDPTIAVTATGAYTKVGRLVTATIGYSNVLTTGASGNVTIAGLPFTGAASSAGSVITFDMFTTSTTLACWNTGTTIAFYVSGGYVPATHNAGASRSVTVTITYYV